MTETTPQPIDSLLQPFQRFGVHLGLARITRLLADLGNPHQQVPIIHVGGTNGKGSVTAYLSSILTAAGYRVGRYTSPHLINWTERICLNEKPISESQLADLIWQIQAAITFNYDESPTQFEVITAAAWLYFAQEKADIAVMEVGLGGRLDATNVCERPLVSVITSISREHWQNLGSTLGAIATEKAGILKANCPAVIGVLPPEAEAVFRAKIQELNCPTIWAKPALKLANNWAKYEDISEHNQVSITYPLPLLGDIQLSNSALAIAAISILQKQGWNISEKAIQEGMQNTRWLGRLQWLQWQNQKILIDGAHNPAAAVALRQYVDSLNQPITWVMGILATKDHEDIFLALLRPHDQLYLVPVPDHSTAQPEYLADLALKVCPNLSNCQTFFELFMGMEQAIRNSTERLIVLCGSLYLIGYFLQHQDSN